MMDDRLLNELGNLARQQHDAERVLLDERWDRLAAGTLTADEDAELKALADSSPEARMAYDAFRPLGADFQARVVSELVAELQPEPPKPWLRLLQFLRAARRVEVWFRAAAVAAAAGVFFLVGRIPPPPALPVYTADMLIGNQTSRGGEPSRPAGTPVFFPGSPLTLVVRPLHPVTFPVRAQSFLAHGATLGLWEPGVVSSNGTVQLQGQLDPAIQPGEWKVLVVVGRPGRIPSLAKLRAELRAGRTGYADWQAVSRDFRVASRASP